MSRYIVRKKENKYRQGFKKNFLVILMCVLLVGTSVAGVSLYLFTDVSAGRMQQNENTTQDSEQEDSSSSEVQSYDFMAIISSQAKLKSSSNLFASSSLFTMGTGGGSLSASELALTSGSASSATSNASGGASSGGTSSSVSYTFSNGITSSEVLMALPAGVASVFMTLDEKGWESYDEIVVSVSNVMNLKKSKQSLLTDNDKDLLCALMCQTAVELGSFSGDALSIVVTYEKTAVSKLQETEKVKYSSDVYSQLTSKSQTFAGTHKSGTAAQPCQLVMYKQSFKLNFPVIIYNDTMMISVNDLYQYIDAKYNVTPGTATITISSSSITAEYTAGSSGVYVKDKAVAMDAPMIYVSGAYYIPVNFFANTYSMSYKYAKDEKTMILYDNINQLSTKGSPNNLAIPAIQKDAT